MPPTGTPYRRHTPAPTNTPPSVVVVPPTNTPQPFTAQVQSVQATPVPPVRALPSTGSGGYVDSDTSLILGLLLMLAGGTITLTAMKRRAS
jgi:hypothetical protein